MKSNRKRGVEGKLLGLGGYNEWIKEAEDDGTLVQYRKNTKNSNLMIDFPISLGASE